METTRRSSTCELVGDGLAFDDDTSTKINALAPGHSCASLHRYHSTWTLPYMKIPTAQ